MRFKATFLWLLVLVLPTVATAAACPFFDHNGVFVYLTTSQTVAAGNGTISWDAERYDCGGWWSPFDPKHIRVPAGVCGVRVTISAIFDNDGPGRPSGRRCVFTSFLDQSNPFPIGRSSDCDDSDPHGATHMQSHSGVRIVPVRPGERITGSVSFTGSATASLHGHPSFSGTQMAVEAASYCR